MLFRLSQRTWSTIGGRVVVVKISCLTIGLNSEHLLDGFDSL